MKLKHTGKGLQQITEGSGGNECTHVGSPGEENNNRKEVGLLKDAIVSLYNSIQPQRLTPVDLSTRTVEHSLGGRATEPGKQ